MKLLPKVLSCMVLKSVGLSCMVLKSAGLELYGFEKCGFCPEKAIVRTFDLVL
jgi:hypothetical protein